MGGSIVLPNTYKQQSNLSQKVFSYNMRPKDLREGRKSDKWSDRPMRCSNGN